MVDTRSSLATPAAQGGGDASVARPGPRSSSRRRWGAQALRAPLGLVALVPVGAYVWIAAHQIGYPFELEWMEGGAVEVVRRVALGQGIYVKPSLHFVPWPYTPLYWWLSAGVSHLTGLGFTPLRLVSLVSSLATFVVLGMLVRSETGEWVAGLVAAGLYAATFRLAGDWFDIGRIDSLLLLMLLLTVVAARRSRSWGGGVVVGVLGFLAFFTKQSALVAIAPLLAYMLITRWRAALAAIGTLAGLVGLSTVVMDAATGGWYRYYVFDELTHQGVARNEWTQFWTRDLRPLWLAALVALVGLAVWALSRARETRPERPGSERAGRQRAGRERAGRERAGRERAGLGRAGWQRAGWDRAGWERAGFYCAAAAGMVGASWVSRLHSGGFVNVLMPAFAGVALLAGLGLGALLHTFTIPRAESVPRAPAWRKGAAIGRGVLGLGAAGAVVIQLFFLRYPVAAQIPTKADAAAGHRLLAEIRALPGQVVVLDHPWYAALVGKGQYADVEALHDVLRAGPSMARTDLADNLKVALSNPKIGAVILDDVGNEEGIAAALASGFEQIPVTWDPGDAFFPVAGDSSTRPTLLFVRRGTASGSSSSATPAGGPGKGGA